MPCAYFRDMRNADKLAKDYVNEQIKRGANVTIKRVAKVEKGIFINNYYCTLQNNEKVIYSVVDCYFADHIHTDFD